VVGCIRPGGFAEPFTRKMADLMRLYGSLKRLLNSMTPHHDQNLDDFCRAMFPSLVGMLSLWCDDRYLAQELAQGRWLESVVIGPGCRALTIPKLGSTGGVESRVLLVPSQGRAPSDIAVPAGPTEHPTR
jgi:hypothetical protein